MKKFSKKVLLISTITLAALTPVISKEVTSHSVVQAATNNSQAKGTLKIQSPEFVSLYKKNGDYYRGAKKVTSTMKYYGNPITAKNPTDLDPVQVIIDGVFYYSLGDGGYLKVHNAEIGYTGATLVASYNSYIYNKDGKRLKKYRGINNFVLKKGQKIKIAGKTKEDFPQVYYSVGQGAYVNSANIAQLNGKGVMHLGYNSYVYDKNGKRVKPAKTLLKGNLVSYMGKVVPATDKSAFYFFSSKTSNKKQQLVSRTIKGQEYYAIGKNRYIKALNVDAINGNVVYTTQPTYIIPRSDMVILNKDLEPTDKIAHHNKKIKIKEAVVKGYGDLAQVFYKIMGKDEFLDAGDLSSYDEALPGTSDTRFLLSTEKDYNTLYRSLISFKNEKSTPLYDISGNQIKLDGKYLEKKPEGNHLPEEVYDVNSGWYIWNEKEKKAELYYHLSKSEFSIFAPTSDLPYHYKTQNIPNAFVKASDVDFKGVKVKILNSESQAKNDTALASGDQKKELVAKIANNAKVTASLKYKLSAKDKRENYDNAVQEIKQAVDSSKTTVLEVRELTWYLENSENELDGAKVKVRDINNLTGTEAGKILKVMINANSSLEGFTSVNFYQHWAHKNGYYPSYYWKNSKDTVFMLSREGHKNEILNVADYATER